MIARSGSKRWVSAADAAARKAGVHVGMPAAKAQALFCGLMLVEADPAKDAAALERITLWALTLYSPIVAVDGIDGIVMDTEGADHLQGGELSMVTKIANQFLAKKLTPVSRSPTPGVQPTPAPAPSAAKRSSCLQVSARSQLAVFDQRKEALEVASGAGQLEDFKRHAPRY